MPFTENDLRDLLHRLQDAAAARRELRDLMRDPVLERLQSEVAGLAAVQQKPEDQLGKLVAAQQQIVERLAALAAHVGHLADRAGGLLDESMTRRYRERAGAYFVRVLRRTRNLDASSLEDALEERLTPDELHDGLLTDLIVCGKPRVRPDVEEVWLAVEVSSVVDKEDVRRAVRRCRLLARSGRPVVPVVAGEAITSGAEETARSEQVAVVEDGRIANWDEALQAALGAA